MSSPVPVSVYSGTDLSLQLRPLLWSFLDNLRKEDWMSPLTPITSESDVRVLHIVVWEGISAAGWEPVENLCVSQHLVDKFEREMEEAGLR